MYKFYSNIDTNFSEKKHMTKCHKSVESFKHIKFILGSRHKCKKNFYRLSNKEHD